MFSFFKILFIFPLLLFWMGVQFWDLQRFLQCIKYIILELTSFTALLYLHFPDSWNSFQQVSFLHLHTHVHIICTIFILLPSSPATPHPPEQPFYSLGDLFRSPVLQFCRRKEMKDKNKNMTFFASLRYSYPGSFLVIFPCMYVVQPQLAHL
jgi:hypothetical protein